MTKFKYCYENWVNCTSKEGIIRRLKGQDARIDDFKERVAELEAQLEKAKAEGIREAVEKTKTSLITDGAEWLCHVAELLNYADQLENKE